MPLSSDGAETVQRWQLHGGRSYIESEQNNVAVLHDIFLALRANQTLLPRCSHGTAGFQIIERNYFGTDKAPFEVRVDLSRRLDSKMYRIPYFWAYFF